MLPAHLADNIRKQVLYYLQSTFDFTDSNVELAFERFLNDPETGLFKGPWAQLKRPFSLADESADIPFAIDPGFRPFRHQWRSWKRLSSRGQKPLPTLVTTGTGSGKTECFLFPILDHCLRMKQSGQKGIKAIVLYPMNALATDQEKRFAKTIFRNDTLRAAGIRVGNYTGRYDPSDPGASADSGTKGMGQDHGISNHAAQQESPPDILLTNYKMLDYLLLRPQDQNLWRFNEPGVLQFLVLDELHTYDGAQGSDVACLIRRLKERLQIPQGELCVVGTSATLDDREPEADSGDGTIDAQQTGSDRLADFASTLFEEKIPFEAVIGEDRLSVEQIIRAEVADVRLPDADECRPRDDEDALTYAQRQSGIWGGPEWTPTADATAAERDVAHDSWATALGDWLKGASLFKYLLQVFDDAEQSKAGPLTWRDLVERVRQSELGFINVREYDDRSAVVGSFFALVAHAKELRSGMAFPLVPTQVQLWIRELRRLGRIVEERPSFIWLDEPLQDKFSLPTFHCSECGESGWIAVHDTTQDSAIQARGVDGIQLGHDPKKIYGTWFGYRGQRGQHAVVITPWPKGNNAETVEDAETSDEDLVWMEQKSLGFMDGPKQKRLKLTAKSDAADSSEPPGQPATEDDAGDGQKTFGFSEWYLCPASLVLRAEDGPCPLTGDPRRFRVRINRETRQDQKSGQILGDQKCPCCGSSEGLFFIGSQSATLSSVAIDEMFGSVLNNDPKLLAFTDSVQDASHRAGFFSSRTYNFTFRTALQHVINKDESTGVPLVDVGHRILEHWSLPRPEGLGSVKEAMASLLPPDLHEYPDWKEFRDNPAALEPPKRLREDIERRITWEATSEFGLMQTHGRTMEASGSSCLTWDEARIAATIEKLRERLPGLDAGLATLSDEDFQLWIYGWLHRYRLRGALYHPYLDTYAAAGYWGKYPWGRAIPGRETYPPQGRFKCRLMVTEKDRFHDHVQAATAGGSQRPWHVEWTRRSLGTRTVDETGLLDLIRALLSAGTDAGLFREVHRDGNKLFYSINAGAAALQPFGTHLVCSESDRSIVRPKGEATVWRDSPSLEYRHPHGLYNEAAYTSRQRYYQDRYRKGALRRVVSREHTGLLATEDREQLERDFAKATHSDDPNVLTCTSTLEMGIDIGDLSSTMLCSIPPTTASYLQRIGRAGRATGTALIVSVVNQRPHDLFFYGRPAEMLKGRVDPPGCWLDASAVLVRQYLAFCLDSASKSGVLTELPRSGRQFVEDLNDTNGHLPRTMAWVTTNEAELRADFLNRFRDNVQPDTRTRFTAETGTELIRNRMHQAAGEFERMRRDLENARRRLQEQLKSLGEDEDEPRSDIEQELRVVKGRSSSLSRISALEILTDNGLLPNYAFPERGVRFYGSIYNKHRRSGQDHKPVEIIRPAGVALKELAPSNHFYTHSRRFDVQQIAIGNQQDPLIESWAICGACGHMRKVAELQQPGTSPACPQCGHDSDSNSQLDLGQQRPFIEFSRSQALSQMENYESLSGDHDEERQRVLYQTIRSFDLTADAPTGAVGEDSLPFGVEYLASAIMREVNVGYQGQPGVVAFGPDQEAPDDGFEVCQDCGVVVPAGIQKDHVTHRRSCRALRRHEKLKQEGRRGDSFKWESVYLYRQLKSEAIRLLLPVADDEDVDTLTACIHLGLRLRFEGNPAHLIVTPQVMPDPVSDMKKYYLILLDAVPGGTGYLKTIYQEKDDQQREGEGIMDVMVRARNALETCVCRRLHQMDTREDTDGCYRCIRTYHLQYSSERISRERGIRLLSQLIEAGGRRVPKQKLDAIRAQSLFGSMLEKKFVDTLQSFVVDTKLGRWEQTIIRGGQGFRFELGDSDRLWELELQPSLGMAQGVSIQSQPDFLLRCDDQDVRPVAIFTDGFEFHVHPHNKLADDLRKRRAILESGNYQVWSVTWSDLDPGKADHVMLCHSKVAQMLEKYGSLAASRGQVVPDPRRLLRNGLEQLKAYIEAPERAGWSQLAHYLVFRPLNMLAEQRSTDATVLTSSLEGWRAGNALFPPETVEGGDWAWNDKAGLNQDMLTCMTVDDAISNRVHQAFVLGRLNDSEHEVTGSEFHERWRRFLASMNLYQFCDTFRFWSTSEAMSGDAPDLPFAEAAVPIDEWQDIVNDVAAEVRQYVRDLGRMDLPEVARTPLVEHFNDNIDDDAFAELAWPALTPPVAVLAGDQATLARKWQDLGWKVIVPDDLQARGVQYLRDTIEQSIGKG